MKNKIKQKLESNNKTKKIFKVLKDFKNSTLIEESGGKKKYPKVLQMPITTRCNSKCVMCNIPNMNKENEMDVEQFSGALKDPIFKNIESIGINGGEPFLLNDLDEYVQAAISNLPNIKSINIISNGFLTKRILDKSELIYDLCKNNNKSFNIMISLDGYGEIHDKVRGIPGAFLKVEKTIRELYSNTQKYADGIELACTVVKQNVDYLSELDTYCKLNGYNIKYRLGIQNERIGNQLILDKFSVFSDEKYRQTAIEFFNYKYHETKDFKYYSLFKYLDNGNKRLLGCDWKENGITMDPKGNIYYCAVESKKIGSINENHGEQIFFDKDNLLYRQQIINKNCDKCIHDYSGKVSTKNVYSYYKERIIERKSIYTYKKGV